MEKTLIGSPPAPATWKQKWYVGKLTGVDCKSATFSKSEGDLMIKLAIAGSIDLVKSKLIERGGKPAGAPSPATGGYSPAKIWEEAHAAGIAAAKKCQPTPMVVQEHASAADDSSPVVNEWLVPAGVCGFAWIKIRPARGAFVKWAKKAGLGDTDSYSGGFTVWIHQFGQSMELKEAYAAAAAEVLRKYGIKAYADSRMD